MRCLGHLPYEEMLQDLGQFSLGMRGDLLYVYKYLTSECQLDGPQFFLVVSSDRTQGKGNKQECRKLYTNEK